MIHIIYHEHAKINQVFCYKDAKENGKWSLEYSVARAYKKVLIIVLPKNVKGLI